MFSSVTEVADVTDDDVVANTSHKLELDGAPNAQERPRIGKCGFCNPNSKAKAAFRAKIKEGISDNPIFKEWQPVAVEIKFHMRRPNTHFKSKDRLKALKAITPFAHVSCPDIDNLAKFVLDGMNGLVHHDDKQVVKLVVHKLFDLEHGCEGRTVIDIAKFD